MAYGRHDDGGARGAPCGAYHDGALLRDGVHLASNVSILWKMNAKRHHVSGATIS